MKEIHEPLLDMLEHSATSREAKNIIRKIYIALAPTLWDSIREDKIDREGLMGVLQNEAGLDEFEKKEICTWNQDYL